MRTSQLLSFATLAVSAAYALPVEPEQVLLQDNAAQYPGFDLDLNALRLVQMEGQPAVYMSELDKINARAQGLRFFDITDTPFPHMNTAALSACNTIPKTPNATEKVNPVLKTLSTTGPKENLAKFTSFRTRYYRSDTGKQSQQWLLSKINEITELWAPTSLRERITVTEFPHSWGQNSIVLRIAGSSGADDGVVIIGAHQDSTNLWPFLPAPGADDDGSGTVTILEAYRALIGAGFSPLHNVEFHWYSAEEGVLGSQQVAQDYASKGVNVIAMSQFDMTAWVKKGTREEVGIITDYVDAEVTEFNKMLVDTYLDIPYVETKCGYACSDHASWSRNGYKGTFTIESSFENSNQHIHSGSDRLDISDEFSFEHMLEFSKLAVAYIVELGGWTESD